LKEFIVVNNTLMVREVTFTSNGFSPTGESLGKSTAVTMRPATEDEVKEYQENKASPQNSTNEQAKANN